MCLQLKTQIQMQQRAMPQPVTQASISRERVAPQVVLRQAVSAVTRRVALVVKAAQPFEIMVRSS